MGILCEFDQKQPLKQRSYVARTLLRKGDETKKMTECRFNALAFLFNFMVVILILLYCTAKFFPGALKPFVTPFHCNFKF